MPARPAPIKITESTSLTAGLWVKLRRRSRACSRLRYRDAQDVSCRLVGPSGSAGAPVVRVVVRKDADRCAVVRLEWQRLLT